MCGSSCVQLATDPQNCGSCGHACPRGQECAGSLCSPPCTAPLVRCGADCVDTVTDEQNCGVCGHACAATEGCAHSTCGAPCTPASPPVEICNGADDDCDRVVDLPSCDPALVAWYRFEETSGPVLDSSGHGLDGTATPTVLRGEPGRIGGAVRFVGEPSSRVAVPDSPLFTFGTSVTVEAWVSADDCGHGTSGHNTLIAKEGEILVAFNPMCELANYMSDGMWHLDPSATPLPTGAWHHVAMTYDGSTIRSYLDGALLGSGTALASAIADTGASLYLGARTDCCVQTLRGLLDEVRIYSTVRTAEEICTDLGGTPGASGCTPPP